MAPAESSHSGRAKCQSEIMGEVGTPRGTHRWLEAAKLPVKHLNSVCGDGTRSVVEELALGRSLRSGEQNRLPIEDSSETGSNGRPGKVSLIGGATAGGKIIAAFGIG